MGRLGRRFGQGMVELPDIESAVRMGDIFAQLVERLGCGAWRVFRRGRGDVWKI